MFESCSYYPRQNSGLFDIPTNLNELPIGERWCFNNMVSIDNGQIVAKALKNGDAITVSDGSYKDQHGTAAWVIEGSNRIGRISGMVITPGHGHDQSTYRSELAGIYSIMVLVHHLCTWFNIDQGSTELGCDGQSVLDKCFLLVSIVKIGTLTLSWLLKNTGCIHLSCGKLDT
jgi:hypothetical protein